MKAKRQPPVVPIDLTGCSVTKKEEEQGSLRFRLKGKTNSGVDVTGYWLSFQSVRNLYTISSFLRSKRVIEDKGTWTDEKSVSYPLKLPAKISACQGTTSKNLSYDDEMLDGLNGPPRARATETVVLFALEERRFDGRGPVPIICESVRLLDKAGNVVTTDSLSANKPQQTEDQIKPGKQAKASTTKTPKAQASKASTQRQHSKFVDQLDELARQFALSVYFGSLAEAKPLMSTGFLKAHGASGIKQATGQYWGVAKRFKYWEALAQSEPYANTKKSSRPKAGEDWHRDFLQKTLGITLTFGNHLQPELENYELPDYISSVTEVRALCMVCSPLFQRNDFDLAFAIVDPNDDGNLRIDAISTFE